MEHRSEHTGEREDPVVCSSQQDVQRAAREVTKSGMRKRKAKLCQVLTEVHQLVQHWQVDWSKLVCEQVTKEQMALMLAKGRGAEVLEELVQQRVHAQPTCSLAELALIRRNNAVSFRQYSRLRKTGEVSRISASSLKAYESEVGKHMAVQVLHSTDGLCHYVNFSYMLDMLLELYGVARLSEQEVEELCTNSRITLDSWKVRKGQPDCALTGVGIVLAMPESSMQSVEDWWLVMAWHGKDSADNCKRYLPPLAQWLEDMQLNGHYSLRIMRRLHFRWKLAADIGSLRALFGCEFCPLCDVPKVLRGVLLDEQGKPHPWTLPPAVHIPCSH